MIDNPHPQENTMQEFPSPAQLLNSDAAPFWQSRPGPIPGEPQTVACPPLSSTRNASTGGPETLRLETPLLDPSPYFLGHDMLDELTGHIAEYAFDKLFLTVDQAVYERYGKQMHQVLAARFGGVDLEVMASGDGCKTFTGLAAFCESLVQKGATKKSILISLGGGAVGNLVGLAAGLVFRGIRYIEIPTTFTGITDSTPSNKQAINGSLGKNLFGMYYAPIFIWCDTQYLRSEPASSTRSGLVEVVKNGFISDPSLLDYFATRLRPDVNYSGAELHEMAVKAVTSKFAILERDPSEKAYGLVLEYGHTFGHAIEWLGNEGGTPISHGEAVAVGMKLAAETAYRLGQLSRDDVLLHESMLDGMVGISPDIGKGLTPDQILHTMLNDNKKTSSGLRLVLLDHIGQCSNPESDWLVSVSEHLVKGVLSDYFS
jgi:3-dehydroquinate synthase